MTNTKEVEKLFTEPKTIRVEIPGMSWVISFLGCIAVNTCDISSVDKLKHKISARVETIMEHILE